MRPESRRPRWRLPPAILHLAWLLLAAALPAHAQAPAASPLQAPEISLVTIGPGTAYFERFGHNALVVREPGGTALAYNYGLFDFYEDDFFSNFLRGRMQYLVAPLDADEDIALYREEGRSVREQVLDLDPAQARTLADFLAWNSRPENARYHYDYFTSNCSTRVRDALDEATGGALRATGAGRSRGYSWRMDALRMMTPQPLLMALIDIGLGPRADQRIDFWQESFIPETLAELVARTRLAGGDGGVRPLVRSDRLLAEGVVRAPPVLPPDLRWPFLVLGLLLGAGTLWLGRRRSARMRTALAGMAALFSGLCGVLGLVLLGLWLGTAHHAAWANENLAVFNPLCLLLVPAWMASRRAGWRPGQFALALAMAVALIACLALFSKVLPWFRQANLHWILLLLPVHVALAWTLLQVRRRPG